MHSPLSFERPNKKAFTRCISKDELTDALLDGGCTAVWRLVCGTVASVALAASGGRDGLGGGCRQRKEGECGEEEDKERQLRAEHG